MSFVDLICQREGNIFSIIFVGGDTQGEQVRFFHGVVSVWESEKRRALLRVLWLNRILSGIVFILKHCENFLFRHLEKEIKLYLFLKEQNLFPIKIFFGDKNSVLEREERIVLWGHEEGDFKKLYKVFWDLRLLPQSLQEVFFIEKGKAGNSRVYEDEVYFFVADYIRSKIRSEIKLKEKA